MPSLLAVDLGLKTGLALFADNGRLIWYRSHNFGTAERLRRGVPGILVGIPELSALVIEGGQSGDRPTSLRHDAAEAIMIGLWGLLRMGWLASLPKELQR